MSFSIMSAAAIALGLATSVPTATAPTDLSPTHTLTLRHANEGCLIIDGQASDATTLKLANAHVATRVSEGGELATVALPDGRTHYMGDFTLRVQSATLGTIEVELCDGEAILSAVKTD